MYIPHPELNPTIRTNDDIILVPLVINFFVQTDVAHNAVNETGREGGFTRVMDVPFKIGRKPKSNIRGAAVDLEVEIRARKLTAHSSSNRRFVAAQEHTHAVIDRLVPCTIMGEDERQVYRLLRCLNNKVPFRPCGVFDFACPSGLFIQETVCLR